jgi:hypothetical protein
MIPLAWTNEMFTKGELLRPAEEGWFYLTGNWRIGEFDLHSSIVWLAYQTDFLWRNQ